MPFDWDDLRVLLALERAGSISGAARELRVDHSTVSRRLAALEEGLGVRLVTRAADGLLFTPAGERALASARTVEGSLSRLETAVGSEVQELAGTVRISTASGLASLVTRLLQPLRDAHPDLAIEVSGVNSPVDLKRREADLALRMSRPQQPDLVAQRACEIGWALYASDSYLERKGMPAALGDFTGHELVLYLPDLGVVPGPRWLEEHQGKGRSVLRADSTQTALLAADAGSGIAVLPAYMAAEQPHLRRLFPEVVAFNEGFLVFHEDVREVARVRAVAQTLLAELGKIEAWLRGDL